MQHDQIEFLLPLFVPGDRPSRIAKAISSRTDSIIIDLEDAVSSTGKVAARDSLEHVIAESKSGQVGIFVRVNAANTPWYADDVSAVEKLDIDGVIIPKAEKPVELKTIVRRFGRHRVVALIECAAGIANARALASVVGRIAFGSIDFAADVGCRHSREALLLARLELVLAARLAGLPGPTDGVTTAIEDPLEVTSDAAYAASLGFAGKLLIHPHQIAHARRGFSPSDSELAWATRVISEFKEGSAVSIDGLMVDAPVFARAQQIVRRSKLMIDP